MTRTIGFDLSRPFVVRMGNEWRVWVPYEGAPRHKAFDESGDILAPYGDAYFDTFEAAADFLGEVIDKGEATFSCWGLKCYECGYTQFFKHPDDVFIVCCGCAETIYPYELA